MACELNKITDFAKLWDTIAGTWTAIAAAIIEHPDEAQVRILLLEKLRDQGLALVSAADYHGAAVEAAFSCPFQYQ
jgi:hypothetical protein